MSTNQQDNRLAQVLRSGERRNSFTLVEMLIVITIMGILSSAMLFALYETLDSAKEARTRAEIAKIDSLIMPMWESYTTRVLPIQVPWDNIPAARQAEAMQFIGSFKLQGTRELMRMELPDRVSDLEDEAVFLTQLNDTSGNPTVNLALYRVYERRVDALQQAAGNTVNVGQRKGRWPGWSTSYQGSECLYLILASIRDGDTTGLDFFKETEIGDVDEDGMPEILDGWGQPILFLRWAPGYSYSPGADEQWGEATIDDNSDMEQLIDDVDEKGMYDDVRISDLHDLTAPDQFDPLDADAKTRQWHTWVDSSGAAKTGIPARNTYALYPLIMSPGRDKKDSIADDTANTPLRYAHPPIRQNLPTSQTIELPSLPNDPFLVIPRDSSAGSRDSQVGSPVPGRTHETLDNISNHMIQEI